MARRSQGDHSDGSLALVDVAGTEVLAVPRDVAESVRVMLARLRMDDGVELPDLVGVTSALSGEGVTTVARCLALVLSNDAGRRVCLVDFNWESPWWWPDQDGAPAGVADIVAAGAPLDSLLVDTGTPGVSLLPAGLALPAERPLMANSAALDDILAALRERFDHVIVELPAVLQTSEALTLAERTGHVILVVHQGVTTDADLRLATDRLAGVPVLGAVLNNCSSPIPSVLRRRLPAV